jgi:arylformamidase
VPEHPEIIVGWERDAASYRAARSDHSELGLRYGKHPRQIIDLFYPDAPDEARPVIVFIHGGYWRTFDPSFCSHFAAGMNLRGFAVALPGYRLCPEVTVAEIIDDIRAAVLNLRRRFSAPFVATGYSAGGHLAATMVATDWAAHGAPSDLLRHGLSISGVFDLTPLVDISMNHDLRLDRALARAVSPLFWDAPADVTFEAWVGGAESEEFLRQSRLVAERWSKSGAKTRFQIIPGANHFTAPAQLTDAESPMVAALTKLAEAAGGQSAFAT